MINPEEVLKYVARSYNISVDSLKSNSKKQHILDAKYTVTWLLKEKFHLQSKNIAKVLELKYDYMASIYRKKALDKMKDEDFKSFIQQLCRRLETGEDVKGLSMDMDLRYFESLCEQRGKCLVAKYMKCSSTSLGRKYRLSTNNQLYYILKNKIYPNWSVDRFVNMKPFCKTKNCVKHWEAEEGDGCVNLDGPNEEVIHYSSGERLIYAIIESAIAEKDAEYFKSSVFFDHLRALGVTNSGKILQFLPNWAKL